MKNEKKNFKEFLIDTAKKEIQRGELTQPLVFFFKENSIGLVKCDTDGLRGEDELDRISICIRTFTRRMKDCTIGVIMEGTESDGENSTELIIIGIEDGSTITTINFYLDEQRNIKEIVENTSSASGHPALRFQNFFRTDYRYNNHLIEELLGNLGVRKFSGPKNLEIIKDIARISEKGMPLSFVLYKKIESTRLYSSILNYDTSTRDIDTYYQNKENEVVSWVKFYVAKKNYTNEKKELIAVTTTAVGTDMTLLEVYELVDNRSVKAIGMRLHHPILGEDGEDLM